MSVFSSLKPDGGTSLRSFDLSHRDIFSVKAGVLNVNLIQHTIPESQYKVNHAQITRVDPVQSAPFARMSENYEYYFVPYSQIFHDFERLYYERGDNQRNTNDSAIGQQYQPSPYVPTFNYSQVIQRLATYYVRSRVYLLAKNQYPAYVDNLRSALYSLTSQYDVNDWLLPFDVHGEICIDEMIKLFDMLGYGNLYSTFSSLFDPFFDVMPPSFDGVVTSEDVTTYNNNWHRMLEEHFGYDVDGSAFIKYPVFADHLYEMFQLGFNDSDIAVPAYTVPNVTPRQRFINIAEPVVQDLVFNEDSEYSLFANVVQNLDEYSPNVLALAAYVKVFSDIYRNTQYDLDNYASLFNFDYVTDPVTSAIPVNKIILMLVPRFRQYKKDLFTGTFPNAQFGSVAVSSLQNPADLSVSTNATDSWLFLKRDSNNKIGIGPTGQTSTSPAKFNFDSGVSALAIRQALSLQRYKERILRAGNRLTALQNAVFGDKSRFIEDSYVQFVGAEKNNIDFNSVAATSDAGSSEVGQLSANGVGTHVGKAFEFHSHDFGILIGIYYILPESEYESYMIDPQNQKSESNDYYKPDFMNLGLSPVWNYDYNMLAHDSQIGDVVLGYLANYWEYKTNVDKVHGSFYGSLPFETDTYNYNYLPDLPTAYLRARGSNALYVTPRNARDLSRGMSVGVLYCNPHDIDSIFYANSDFTLVTDQFKCNCNHDIKALLPMSVVGLPEY